MKLSHLILKFPTLSIMDQGGAHRPHPSLLNHWLLMYLGWAWGTVIAYSWIPWIPNHEPSRLHWTVQNLWAQRRLWLESGHHKTKRHVRGKGAHGEVEITGWSSKERGLWIESNWDASYTCMKWSENKINWLKKKTPNKIKWSFLCCFDSEDMRKGRVAQSCPLTNMVEHSQYTVKGELEDRTLCFRVTRGLTMDREGKRQPHLQSTNLFLVYRKLGSIVQSPLSCPSK